MLSFSAFRAKLQQGGGVLLFPSWWGGVEGGRGAGAVPGHPRQQGGGVLLFPSWWAWKVGVVPVLFLGIHCNRAADHPRSSDVSRPISRPLCPHTKRSKTLRNVTSSGKLCEILHFAPNCVDLQTVIVSDARRGRSHIPPPVGRGGGETAPSVAAALLCENMT